LCRRVASDIHATYIEAIGVGVFGDFEHLRNDDVVKLGSDAFLFLDLKTGHGEEVRELGPGHCRIDESAKPGF